MSNPAITLAEFLNWLRHQRDGRIIDVETYCRERFDSHSVRVWPQEIRVSFRYAWTDSYTPDEGLTALIKRGLRPMPAGELLSIAESAEANRLEAAMRATDHLEPLENKVANLGTKLEAVGRFTTFMDRAVCHVCGNRESRERQVHDCEKCGLPTCDECAEVDYGGGLDGRGLTQWDCGPCLNPEAYEAKVQVPDLEEAERIKNALRVA